MILKTEKKARIYIKLNSKKNGHLKTANLRREKLTDLNVEREREKYLNPTWMLARVWERTFRAIEERERRSVFGGCGSRKAF
jgi:hypothetical protein